MTEKRFSRHIDFFIDNKRTSDKLMNMDEVVDLLNEQHEEIEFLKVNNKELVQFIKSKGYTLKEFIKYIGQFSSVGINKEDWND